MKEKELPTPKVEIPKPKMEVPVIRFSLGRTIVFEWSIKL